MTSLTPPPAAAAPSLTLEPHHVEVSLPGLMSSLIISQSAVACRGSRHQRTVRLQAMFPGRIACIHRRAEHDIACKNGCSDSEVVWGKILVSLRYLVLFCFVDYTFLGRIVAYAANCYKPRRVIGSSVLAQPNTQTTLLDEVTNIAK